MGLLLRVSGTNVGSVYWANLMVADAYHDENSTLHSRIALLRTFIIDIVKAFILLLLSRSSYMWDVFSALLGSRWGSYAGQLFGRRHTSPWEFYTSLTYCVLRTLVIVIVKNFYYI
jgi:hypothetical protein